MLVVSVVVVVVGDGAKVECADVTCIKRWICEEVVVATQRGNASCLFAAASSCHDWMQWLVWKKNSAKESQKMTLSLDLLSSLKTS
jgi:hypothetical protein